MHARPRGWRPRSRCVAGFAPVDAVAPFRMGVPTMRSRFHVLAAGLLLAAAGTAGAATYTVTKTADTADGTCDADCSLREAVAAATATPDDDVIVFDAGVFASAQTITLAGSEIAIAGNGNLVIEGPGADLLTLDGNGTSRILSNGAGAVTTVRDLRFTGGNGVGAANSGRAGAIYNNGGTLVLERLVVEGNSAANGGALNNASAGTLIVVDSLVAGNSATGSGGAIQNFSTSILTIRGSTFSGNTSNGTTGGGAGQINGTAVIANSTFSGNDAPSGSGGGITSNGTSILVVNSTFTGNSALNNAGGFHRASSNLNVFLRNNVFAGNATTNGVSPDVTASVSVTSLGNNLVGVAGPTSGWIASDLLDQDPLLGALADNGGPTPSHALLDGSPAIDAGQDCVLDQSCADNNLAFDLDTDQRGMPRPAGPATDIGAYEVQAGMAVPIYDNGPLGSGTQSNSGVAAPAGYEWSEVQNDDGVTTYSNTLAGVSGSVTATVFRIADDFTVPAGEVWRLDSAVFYAYQTGFAGTDSPIGAYTLRVWDGRPDDPGSNVLCGDETTNRLVDSVDAGLFRIFNSAVPAPGIAPAANRRIWASTVEVPADCAGPGGFTEGTYWLDWNSQIGTTTAHFAPTLTLPGQRFRTGDNARQRVAGGVWQDVIDIGNPDAIAPDVPQDFPFLLFGQVEAGNDLIFADGFESP